MLGQSVLVVGTIAMVLLLLFSIVSSGFVIAAPTPRSEDAPLITLPSLGMLRGTTATSFFTQRTIYHYLGINYAMAPSEEKRFQPPQKFPPWTGIYNATKMRQQCPQVEMTYYPPLPPDLIDRKSDEEDCLVLNVYTPKVPTSEGDPLLPVLFFIHGGSFYAGSAYDFYPDFLLEKDILLVVIQYRLGPLGFFSLQTDAIPGNAGMLDMVMALEWVQDNIKWFGGDRTKVTVMGQSAGAAAVSSLLVSPLVPDGFFSQMALHSGSALSPWAVNENPVQSTRIIASFANCYSDDTQEIVDCLKKVPVKDLVTAEIAFLETTPGAALQACALVVQEAGGNKKYLVEPPSVSFEKGTFKKVPIMGGTTRDEGSAFLPELYSLRANASSEYFSRNVTKESLGFLGLVDKTNAVIDMYQNKYFNRVKNFNEAAPALIDLFSVMLLKAPTNEVIRRMSFFKPSYLYSFNFLGNVSKLAASEPDWDDIYPFPTGVAHSDELGYLFPSRSHEYTGRELAMVKTMVNLWTNFIINGKPTPTPEVRTWSTMQDEFGPYLKIDQSSVQKSNVFFEYEVNQREGYVTTNSASRVFNVLLSIFSVLHVFFS